MLINLNKLESPTSLARLSEGRNIIIAIYHKVGHCSILGLVLLRNPEYINTVNKSGGMTTWSKTGFGVSFTRSASRITHIYFNN